MLCGRYINVAQNVVELAEVYTAAYIRLHSLLREPTSARWYDCWISILGKLHTRDVHTGV